MSSKKIGLNDFDKVAVTVALWISALSLFAVAFSLPMLPEKVSVFYSVSDASNTQSKYYNLVLVIMSLIPAIVVLIAASLKRRNRLKNNFMSIILFAVMLSLCTGSVMIYGIMQQFHVSSAADSINTNALIVVLAEFLFSMFSAFCPLIIHAPQYAAKAAKMSEKTEKLVSFALSDWAVGAYGYCGFGVIAAFTPGAFCYIPLAVGVVAHAIYCIIRIKNTGSPAKQEPPAEQTQENLI